MQIFVVDESPHIAAKSLADMHLTLAANNGVLLLCQYYHRKGQPAPLKKSSKGTLLVDWLVSNPNHYMWLWRNVESACDEWRYRFDRQHSAESILAMLPRFEKANGTPKTFCNGTGWALMRGETVPELYRRYYVGKCLLGAVWTKRMPPVWVPMQVPGERDTWTTLRRTRSKIGASIWSDPAWSQDWLNSKREIDNGNGSGDDGSGEIDGDDRNRGA